MDSILIYAALCLSAFLAGAINSIAGGGTLLTFPALLAVVSPVVANATSTIALVPGSLAGAWGYRQDVQHPPRLQRMIWKGCFPAREDSSGRSQTGTPSWKKSLPARRKKSPCSSPVLNPEENRVFQ